jgi:plasmid stabilization system protein ParE
MTLQVKISRRAAKQIQQAADWWAKNRPAAPGAVAKDVGVLLNLLAEQPSIGSEYKGARAPEIKRVFLSRIGYFIYYRASSDALEVLAFWHARRGSGPSI